MRNNQKTLLQAWNSNQSKPSSAEDVVGRRTRNCQQKNLQASSESEVPMVFDMDAGKTWIFPTMDEPSQGSQMEIVKKCLFKNSLVVMPDESNRKLIAIAVMLNFYRWYPKGKIILLVPTKMLQCYLKAFVKISDVPESEVASITNNEKPADRKHLWEEKRVIFIPPHQLVYDMSGDICPVSSIKCLVFAEAKGAADNLAYQEITRQLTSVVTEFRVLALIATIDGDTKVLKQMLSHLLISHVESPVEQGSDDDAHWILEKKMIQFGDDFSVLKAKFLDFISIYVKRLNQRKAFNVSKNTALTKSQLLKLKDVFNNQLSGSMERYVSKLCSTDFSILITLYHAYELFIDCGMKSSFKYISGILAGETSNRSSREAAMHTSHFEQLHKYMKESYFCETDGHGVDKNTAETSFELKDFRFEHPKMQRLREIVSDHFSKINSDSSKVIIFCQCCESVTEIEETLIQYHELLKVTTFIGKVTKQNNLTFQSQNQQLEVLKELREGLFNTLVCTFPGEENFAADDADLIVFYDVPHSCLCFLQSANQKESQNKSKIVILAMEGKESEMKEIDWWKNDPAFQVIGDTTEFSDLYQHDSRMVPDDINPECVLKMVDIDLEKDDSNRNPAFLTKKEKAYFKKKFHLPEENVPTLPTSSFLSLDIEKRKMTLRNMKKRKTLGTKPKPELSLNNWIPWQSIPQQTALVSHSSKCEAFIKILNFIDFPQTIPKYNISLADAVKTPAIKSKQASKVASYLFGHSKRTVKPKLVVKKGRLVTQKEVVQKKPCNELHYFNEDHLFVINKAPGNIKMDWLDCEDLSSIEVDKVVRDLKPPYEMLLGICRAMCGNDIEFVMTLPDEDFVSQVPNTLGNVAANEDEKPYNENVVTSEESYLSLHAGKITKEMLTADSRFTTPLSRKIDGPSFSVIESAHVLNLNSCERTFPLIKKTLPEKCFKSDSKKLLQKSDSTNVVVNKEKDTSEKSDIVGNLNSSNYVTDNDRISLKPFDSIMFTVKETVTKEQASESKLSKMDLINEQFKLIPRSPKVILEKLNIAEATVAVGQSLKTVKNSSGLLEDFNSAKVRRRASIATRPFTGTFQKCDLSQLKSDSVTKKSVIDVKTPIARPKVLHKLSSSDLLKRRRSQIERDSTVKVKDRYSSNDSSPSIQKTVASSDCISVKTKTETDGLNKKISKEHRDLIKAGINDKQTKTAVCQPDATPPIKGLKLARRKHKVAAKNRLLQRYSVSRKSTSETARSDSVRAVSAIDNSTARNSSSHTKDSKNEKCLKFNPSPSVTATDSILPIEPVSRGLMVTDCGQITDTLEKQELLEGNVDKMKNLPKSEGILGVNSMPVVKEIHNTPPSVASISEETKAGDNCHEKPQNEKFSSATTDKKAMDANLACNSNLHSSPDKMTIKSDQLMSAPEAFTTISEDAPQRVNSSTSTIHVENLLDFCNLPNTVLNPNVCDQVEKLESCIAVSTVSDPSIQSLYNQSDEWQSIQSPISLKNFAQERVHSAGLNSSSKDASIILPLSDAFKSRNVALSPLPRNSNLVTNNCENTNSEITVTRPDTIDKVIDPLCGLQPKNHVSEANAVFTLKPKLSDLPIIALISSTTEPLPTPEMVISSNTTVVSKSVAGDINEFQDFIVTGGITKSDAVTQTVLNKLPEICNSETAHPNAVLCKPLKSEFSRSKEVIQDVCSIIAAFSANPDYQFKSSLDESIVIKQEKKDVFSETAQVNQSDRNLKIVFNENQVKSVEQSRGKLALSKTSNTDTVSRKSQFSNEVTTSKRADEQSENVLIQANRNDRYSLDKPVSNTVSSTKSLTSTTISQLKSHKPIHNSFDPPKSCEKTACKLISQNESHHTKSILNLPISHDLSRLQPKNINRNKMFALDEESECIDKSSNPSIWTTVTHIKGKSRNATDLSKEKLQNLILEFDTEEDEVGPTPPRFANQEGLPFSYRNNQMVRALHGKTKNLQDLSGDSFQTKVISTVLPSAQRSSQNPSHSHITCGINVKSNEVNNNKTLKSKDDNSNVKLMLSESDGISLPNIKTESSPQRKSVCKGNHTKHKITESSYEKGTINKVASHVKSNPALPNPRFNKRKIEVIELSDSEDDVDLNPKSMQNSLKKTKMSPMKESEVSKEFPSSNESNMNKGFIIKEEEDNDSYIEAISRKGIKVNEWIRKPHESYNAKVYPSSSAHHVNSANDVQRQKHEEQMNKIRGFLVLPPHDHQSQFAANNQLTIPMKTEKIDRQVAESPPVNCQNDQSNLINAVIQNMSAVKGPVKVKKKKESLRNKFLNIDSGFRKEHNVHVKKVSVAKSPSGHAVNQLTAKTHVDRSFKCGLKFFNDSEMSHCISAKDDFDQQSRKKILKNAKKRRRKLLLLSNTDSSEEDFDQQQKKFRTVCEEADPDGLLKTEPKLCKDVKESLVNTSKKAESMKEVDSPPQRLRVRQKVIGSSIIIDSAASREHLPVSKNDNNIKSKTLTRKSIHDRKFPSEAISPQHTKVSSPSPNQTVEHIYSSVQRTNLSIPKTKITHTPLRKKMAPTVCANDTDPTQSDCRESKNSLVRVVSSIRNLLKF